jgi:hypothetical protein
VFFLGHLEHIDHNVHSEENAVTPLVITEGAKLVGENASPNAAFFPSLGGGRLVVWNFRPRPTLRNYPAARLTRGDEEHFELAIVLAPNWNCCNLI